MAYTVATAPHFLTALLRARLALATADAAVSSFTKCFSWAANRALYAATVASAAVGSWGAMPTHFSTHAAPAPLATSVSFMYFTHAL